MSWSALPKVSREGVKTRTKQSFKKECDINFLMARYLKSGNVDHLAKHGGSYGFVEALSFHDALNVVLKGEEVFNDLPSDLRKRFGNDPAAFLDFATNKDNLEELRKLGLAKPAAPAPAAPGAAIVPPAGG